MYLRRCDVLFLGCDLFCVTNKLKCWTKAKVYIHSDSVLCLGKIHDNSEANEKWKSQLQDFQETNRYRELFGIDGGSISFEWDIFPERTSLQILQKIQVWFVTSGKVKPEKFDRNRIIFMSMLNDIG